MFQKRSKRAAGGFLKGRYKWHLCLLPIPWGPLSFPGPPGGRVSRFPSSLFFGAVSWLGVHNTVPLACWWQANDSFWPSLEPACFLWHTEEDWKNLCKQAAVHLERGLEGIASSKEPAPAAVCKWLLGIASLALVRLEDHLANGPDARLTDGLGCWQHSPH